MRKYLFSLEKRYLVFFMSNCVFFVHGTTVEVEGHSELASSVFGRPHRPRCARMRMSSSAAEAGVNLRALTPPLCLHVSKRLSFGLRLFWTLSNSFSTSSNLLLFPDVATSRADGRGDCPKVPSWQSNSSLAVPVADVAGGRHLELHTERLVFHHIRLRHIGIRKRIVFLGGRGATP